MKKSKICSYASVVLMAVLLILQFSGFWSYDGMSTSIQKYLWFPTDHDVLAEYISSALGVSHNINDIVFMPFMVLLLGVIGIAVCAVKPAHAAGSLLPLAAGVIGAWGYLTKAPFQLGTNWILHLIVCILLIVTSVLTYVFLLKNE